MDTPNARYADVGIIGEESRRRPEDLIGPPQLSVLLLEGRDALLVGGADAWPAPVVNLRLLDPLAQGLGAHAELGRDPGKYAVALTAALELVEHHPDAPVTKLSRVPMLNRSLVVWHISIFSNRWSLHKTQCDSPFRPPPTSWPRR